MAWQDDTVSLIRFMIGDFGETKVYCDNELEELLFGSARFVIFDLGFANDYVVNISTSTITPDPSTDYDFQTLIAIKASYLILSSEFKFYSSQGVSVSDGPSSITLTNVSAGYKQRMQDLLAEYNKAKLVYALGNGSDGQFVTTKACNQYWGWCDDFGWREQYPCHCVFN